MPLRTTVIRLLLAAISIGATAYAARADQLQDIAQRKELRGGQQRTRLHGLLHPTTKIEGQLQGPRLPAL